MRVINKNNLIINMNDDNSITSLNKKKSDLQ